jgi:hypothetical protein
VPVQDTTRELAPLTSGDSDGAASTSTSRPILGSSFLGTLFDAKFFLISAVIGFVSCCYLGHLASATNQFGKIERFGLVLGPQACFYPTIKQLISFALSRSGDNKTIVIVGGSSILNGVGQTSQEIWTKKLQERLGSTYSVVNLGLRSCTTFEGGYYVAEALLKQSKKVIFVTCTLPSGTLSPLGFPTYAHLYWDAKYHNLLYTFPERDAAIKESERTLPDSNWTADALNELKLSRLFNSVLCFSEFWNTIGYKYFFTIYSPVTSSAPFAPLRRIPEPEAFERFPVPEHQMAMNSVRDTSNGMFDWNSTMQRWEMKKKAWDGFDKTIRTNVAPQVRPNTLVLLLYHNPQYRSELTESEQRRDKLAYEAAQAMIRKEGLQAIQSGDDYKPEDFRDTRHLSPSGGARLADQVAVAVVQMAHKLRYEN